MNETAEEVVPPVSGDQATGLVEYTKTEAELAKLRQRYSGVVWDCRDAKQDADARRVRRELVSLRTSLDKMRLQLNEDDRRRIDLRNAEARRIESEIRLLEAPVDEAIKSEEKRREEEREARRLAEQKRTDELRQRISDIAQVAINAVDLTSSAITEKLALVERIAITEEAFAEMMPSAAAVKADTLARLASLQQRALRVVAERAAAERNRLELERLRREDEERREREAEQARQQAAERARLEAAERARQEQQRRDREAAEAVVRRRQSDVERAREQIRRVARGAAVATAAGVAKLIDQVKAIATPDDLGDLAGLVDAVRDEVLEDLATALDARQRAEQEAREAAERRRHNEMLMSEIDGIRQQLVVAQLGRAPYYRGGNVEDVEKILAETRTWVIDQDRFGVLYHSAEAVKTSTIQGLEQYLELLRKPVTVLAEPRFEPEQAPAADAEPAQAPDAPVAGPAGGGGDSVELGPLEDDATAIGAKPSQESEAVFLENMQLLLREVVATVRVASRSKAAARSDGPYNVPAAEFRAMCEALTRVRRPDGASYDGAGKLCVPAAASHSRADALKHDGDAV